MKAIFTFWDVEYLEELTLNFRLADYDKYGSHGVMSGVKPDDHIQQDDLQRALENIRKIEDSEHFEVQIDWSKIINYNDKYCNLAKWAYKSKTCYKEVWKTNR